MRGSSRTRRISVVLPAPEGDDTMKRSPRVIGRLSFDVLDLFLESLELRLQVEDELRRSGLPDLRAGRVHLTVQLLREVVEAAADGAVGSEEAPRLGEVRLEAVDLLRDVCAV